MLRFSNIFLLLAFTAQFATGQMKTIDIPGVHSPDDIKVDRMSNGSYVAAYFAEGKTSVAFYDENFDLQKKIDLQISWGKAGHFVFSSDGDLLCIGFPKAADERAETDFNFFVLKTSGEQLATKIFPGNQIKAVVMKGNRILISAFSKKENALTNYLLDTKLNSVNQSSTTLEKKSTLDIVRAAFVSNEEAVVAYAYTMVEKGSLMPAVRVLGFKTSDGAQFINLTQQRDDGNYSVDYIGKGAGGTYVVMGSYIYNSFFTSSAINGTGVFKLVVNHAGQKQSFISQSMAELLPETAGKAVSLFVGGYYGNNTQLAADYIMPQDNGGYLIIVHFYNKRILVLTDSSLKSIDHTDLRKSENDGGDWIYEDVLCHSKQGGVPTLIYMTKNKDGVGVVFSSKADLKNPESKEWMNLDGKNKNPPMDWTNDNNQPTDKHYDLKNCNPSLVPSDASHVVLLDDDNKDARGARIYVFSGK